MSSHSDICPSSQTGDEYECVCTYIELERKRIIALLEAEWWMRPSNKARLIALIKGDEIRIVQDNDATYTKGENK